MAASIVRTVAVKVATWVALVGCRPRVQPVAPTTRPGAPQPAVTQQPAPVEASTEGAVATAPEATETTEPTAPAVELPVEAVEEVEAPTPCGKVDRGVEQRKHEYIGERVAALEEQGGNVICGGGALWQLRFGTTCGDRASFHRVVTVAVRAGRVQRVWTRQQYNDSFCGERW